MHRTCIRAAVAVIFYGLTMVTPARPQSIEECAWRQPAGSCHASIREHPVSGMYDVSTSSRCAKIDILVDGTVYEHRLPNGGTETGNIMVFEKERRHSVSVSACNVYKTKSDVLVNCKAGTEQSLDACLGQARPQIDACATKAQEIARDATSDADPGQAYASCAAPVQSEFLGCAQSSVETGNSCAKGRAFEFSAETGLIVHQNYAE